MQDYFFYSTATGEIMQSGNVPAYAIEHQVPPEGQAIALGVAAVGKQCYIGGELVDVPVVTPVIDAAAVLTAWRERTEISRFQACAALYQAGYMAQIDAYMITADPIAKMAWETSQAFRRNSITVIALQKELDIADHQMDDLFRFALTIMA